LSIPIYIAATRFAKAALFRLVAALIQSVYWYKLCAPVYCLWVLFGPLPGGRKVLISGNYIFAIPILIGRNTMKLTMSRA
jgi:hypothetical protein